VLSVNQFVPSALTSTRVAVGLLPPSAPDVIPPPEKFSFVMAKNVLPKIWKSTPNGFDGLRMMGGLNCSVIEPFVPMETSCDLENGGANGVTEALAVGAPSAAEALVKPAAKPVPEL